MTRTGNCGSQIAPKGWFCTRAAGHVGACAAVPVFGGERGKEDFAGTIDGVGYKKSMDDPNKPPLTQVPPLFIEGIARVLQFGMKKYSRGNWMRGMKFSAVLDALKRHVAAIETGEDIDPDSGLPHVYHVGCDAAFLAWYMFGPRRTEYEPFDDRLYKTPGEPAEHPLSQRFSCPKCNLFYVYGRCPRGCTFG